MDFEANCRATGIGSFPHTDIDEAWKLMKENFTEIPFWPQLPQRSLYEDMMVQFSEKIPGIVIRDGKLSVSKDGKFMSDVEKFYEDYLSGDLGKFGVSRTYAEGLYKLLESKEEIINMYAIKGQVTGPFSLGMSITDQAKRSILYDNILRDVLIKDVAMMARWQEKKLKEVFTRAIIFIDEPYLSAFGSAIFNISRDEIIKGLDEIYSGLSILKGTHCCGNTDWALLLSTAVDIISFDAYQYALNLSLYAEEVKSFIRRGGIIAWGIVPTFQDILGIVPASEDKIDNETVQSLISRLEEGMQLLVGKGLDLEELLHSALITPSCGFGLQTIERAERIVKITNELSNTLKKKYKL